ncbi:MAG TPA: MFS transporter, partial [Ktedonobacter sp.]|nr:MFS transporter [Ktedonobacter sp.]
ADKIVTGMEERARRKVPDLPAPAAEIPVQAGATRIPYAEIFGNRLYLRRTILLVIVWFLGYVTVYAIAQGLTVLLDSLHYPPPESGMIAAFGTFGFILTAIFAYFYGERLERKLWLPIAALLTLIGGILIGVAGPNNFAVAAIGSIITFFGFNLWVPMTYTWSTENYPTRARATGFALVDGIGHLGGGIGILVIAPLIPTLIASLGLTTGPIVIFVIIAAFLIAAAIVAQFGTATRQKRLDEVSP